MLVCAKIMLPTGVDAARDGLAGLASHTWMMSLPRQEAYGGHPAGRARPGHTAPGGSGLVAVVFGNMAASRALLPARWESLEPGDEFSVLLDGDITLAAVSGQAQGMLTLSGVCRLIPATLIACGCEQARMQLIEATRAFITIVGNIVTCSAAPGPDQPPTGPAWSWLSGLPRTP